MVSIIGKYSNIASTADKMARALPAEPVGATEPSGEIGAPI